MRLAPLPILLILAAGCGASPAARGGFDLRAWESSREAYQRSIVLGEWADAAAHLERRLAAYPVPVPATLRRTLREDLYDLACARSMAGSTVAALDALERSMEDGFGGIGFDHLVRDPDLVPLHREERWKALVERLGGGTEPRPAWDLRSGHESDVNVVVVGIALASFPSTGSGQRVSFSTISGPYHREEKNFEWVTRLDHGEHAAELLAARAAAERSVERTPKVLLLGRGPDGIRLAWETVLRRPGAFDAVIFDGGAAPGAWALLDRGAEKVGTRLVAISREAIPDPAIGVKVVQVASLEAAIEEALR